LKASDPVRDLAVIREAGAALAQGELVVFPTETVYGIGASAVSPRAVAALSDLKDRPPDKPFTLHLAGPDEAPRYAGPLSPLARRFMRKAWPGPLTLVVPDRRPRPGEPPGIVEEAVYHNGTVGMRCPAHAVGVAILRAAGVPVVGSSANLGGRPSPRQASEALADLSGKVALVVDAGPAPLGRASTVVRIAPDDTYEILREESIAARRLERMARTRVLFVCTGNLCRSPMAAGLAAKMLAERFGCAPSELGRHGMEVESAGTSASPGFTASPNAIKAMRERGIDIRGHQSRPITVDGLLAADYIWVMTRGHAEAVVRLAPEVAGRAALVDPTGQSVADPIGGDVDVYRACAAHLEKAIAARLAETA
jgi:tRNA threonylcarbamoyl adenosine modification protein (Sua5/YciO/YrdC/YwlC family)